MARKSKKASSYSKKENNQKYFWKAPRTDNQSRFLSSLLDNKITIATGDAGTGKTMFALQIALQQLEKGHIDKIYYVRNDPFDDLGTKPMGALPGDAKEKMMPLLYPILDNLNELTSEGERDYLIRCGKIEAIPFQYLRGRSLAYSFILVDEAQNAPLKAMKLVLSRISKESKIAIIGDTAQKDSNKKLSNGLDLVWNILKGLPGIGIVRFERGDIQRDEIIGPILDRFDQYELKFS